MVDSSVFITLKKQIDDDYDDDDDGEEVRKTDSGR